MIKTDELEEKIGELLDIFYKRRINALDGLDLKKTLKRKNPYLYRAIGVEKASEIVEGILLAYTSSSDEGIFGDAFFEPLAKYVSGGYVSPSEGVDVALETPEKYIAVAVKSGPAVFNAQSKRRQIEDFKVLENRLRKLQKHFDPIVGYSYGNKKQSERGKHSFRELAGQAFWEEITGDENFYLKIIQLMKGKPQEHSIEYKKAWAAAENRFIREFIDTFCDVNGNILWEKIVEFNSGKR